MDRSTARWRRIHLCSRGISNTIGTTARSVKSPSGEQPGATRGWAVSRSSAMPIERAIWCFYRLRLLRVVILDGGNRSGRSLSRDDPSSLASGRGPQRVSGSQSHRWTALIHAHDLRIAGEQRPIHVEHISSGLVLTNLAEPTQNTGVELLGTWRREPFSVTSTCTYVRAREMVETVRETCRSLRVTAQEWSACGSAKTSGALVSSGMTRACTPRRESVSRSERAVLCGRRLGRETVWPAAALRQRRKPERCSSNAMEPADSTDASRRWPLDGGRVGTARRAQCQRWDESSLLTVAPGVTTALRSRRHGPWPSRGTSEQADQ
jgi:hypothetical protein